ncbi:hypothetical protein [Ralstonia syzygii]|uniref:hypothetical protein n=1 Tax=Ralstonia syzygii TaxID=28097 RepID=UPI0018D04409|nr:hypothetical protein [Ralstonia syzygii]CAH0445560.1 hypothetical protein LMG10661_01772 [Ralstonia syzygii subsp. syzygii]
MTPDGDGAWTFDHVNFHVAGEPAILKFFADVLAKLRDSGMPHQVRQHPERAAAQIFVQLPGAIVLELEARLSGPLDGARDDT